MEDLANNYIITAINGQADAPQLNFVTHSIGGILLRYCLTKYNIPNCGRIVMLTPGHAGSPTMTFMNRFPWYRALLGPSGLQSNDDENCFACLLPPLSMPPEIGIIAGNIPLDAVSWAVMREPNDGKLTIEGTKMAGMKDHIVVPASHDTILLNPSAIFQTIHFLGEGVFAH